jgi:hypothetical protein
MKAISLSLLMAAFLCSCQNEASTDDSSLNLSGRNPRKALDINVNTDTNNAQNQTDAPIDGGLALIAVAGVAYGAKKFRGRRK